MVIIIQKDHQPGCYDVLVREYSNKVSTGQREGGKMTEEREKRTGIGTEQALDGRVEDFN